MPCPTLFPRRRASVLRTTWPHAPASITPPAYERLLAIFAALWPGLVGLCSLALAVGVAAYALGRQTWELLQAWSIEPSVILVVSVLLALTGYASVARWTLGARRRRVYAAEYVLRRIRRISGSAFVPCYVSQVYLARKDAATGNDIDRAVRDTIRAASSRPRSSLLAPLGVCVTGAAMQGKTRFAWEALNTTLPGWTLLRWPHEPRRVFELGSLRGKRFVLWLDDLHELAAPTTAAALADMPRRLTQAGARVVVVATCRDGRDERRARRHLGSLLERLTVVQLGNITQDEAEQLAAALAKAGAPVELDQFDGTPGSLLLSVRRMRREDYPALPHDAQHVLHALSLLRSAQIYRYPLSRVLAVASDLFGVEAFELGEACATLERHGWLRLVMTSERELVPLSGVYLEQAISDYLNPNAEISDDWPWLMEMLERRRDVAALRRLGNAFTELVKGVGPLLPYDVGTFKDQGITCLRAALHCCSPQKDALLWSVTQLDLGYSLAARAEVASGVARADLWRQAIAAYSAALDVLPKESSPAYAALAQIRLAEIAHQQAGDALFGGDVRTACARLDEALKYIACAEVFYTPETDPAGHRMIVALQSAIETTQCDLNCEIEDG